MPRPGRRSSEEGFSSASTLVPPAMYWLPHGIAPALVPARTAPRRHAWAIAARAGVDASRATMRLWSPPEKNRTVEEPSAATVPGSAATAEFGIWVVSALNPRTDKNRT